MSNHCQSTYCRKTYRKDVGGKTQYFHDIQPNIDIKFSNESGFQLDREKLTKPECKIREHEILHRKCPVIRLAQKQLENLLDSENMDDVLKCGTHDKSLLNMCFVFITKRYVLASIVFSVTTFVIGLLFGAEACASYTGQFNIPILSRLDRLLLVYDESEEAYTGVG